nr:MAG TPA: portal protein [Caudoviricetes sp.]
MMEEKEVMTTENAPVRIGIGAEQLREAVQTLRKYKQGKANLEQRVIDNEEWYRLRHWECLRQGSKKQQVEPVSAWLLNSIANKHADAMDNFPAPNILPREPGDVKEARQLSAIVPVVLEQAGFEATYSEGWWDKIIGGTAIYGVFWDGSKLNGLGDIAVEPVDILNLFWEPGVTKIQNSANVFHVKLEDNAALEQAYPELSGKLGGNGLDISKYVYDDTVDTTEKSVVVDWYYKKKQNKKTVLHYCKFVGETVLYATENNDGEGWYDHGKYPFVFDPMFRVKGTPCGFGYIDIGKGAQEYIDRGDQAVMQNMLSNAKPRYFVRSDGSVNEQEYADMTKDFVHTDGNLGQDSILPVVGKVLNSIYLNVLDRKVDELKETTGNRDVSTGGSTSGVTAASAIAAMQEAGSKLSRDGNKAAYRAFREVVELVVELIRQFYDLPRQFRILGENGREDFVSYTNAGIKPVYQGMEMGVDMGYRLPVFDIEITAEKASPYSKLSQNELALQFFGAGFFNPQMTDQALACLEMMDFDGKEQIMQRISANGTLYQRLMMAQQQAVAMAQLVDMKLGTNYAMQLLGGAQGTQQPMPGSVPDTGGNSGGESSVTANARKEAADRAAPV